MLIDEMMDHQSLEKWIKQLHLNLLFHGFSKNYEFFTNLCGKRQMFQHNIKKLF